MTPSSQSSKSWAKSAVALNVKESPSRAPDPEHLKFLWSQSSPRIELTGVNSLEGIGDDLIPVPFTLQEVKSEDGETPPPTVSIGPTRMSQHEVTRAFQQVPSPPANAPAHKTGASSLSTMSSPPVSRNGYPLPPANGNMRPAYPAYGSPMLSHSPAPTMVYPHVMSPSPGPVMMNGSSPQYGHPVWMSVPASTGQTPNTVMRPLPSPYPPSYMPYPPPGAAPGMYASPPPTMVHHSQPQSRQGNGGQHRGRNQSVMSPVLSHAGVSHPHVPMYPGSPVLLHAPVMQLQPAYPSPVPAGRGDARSPYAMHAMPMMHHAPAPSHHPPAPSQHPAGFAPAAPVPYARPPW